MIHVRSMGPAVDVSKVRSPKDGCLKAIRSGLAFTRVADGREMHFYFNGILDAARLMEDMFETFQNPRDSETEVSAAREILRTMLARLPC